MCDHWSLVGKNDESINDTKNSAVKVSTIKHGQNIDKQKMIPHSVIPKVVVVGKQTLKDTSILNNEESTAEKITQKN